MRVYGQILVFAAASTAGPLEEIAARFQGHRVQFAYGASSDLARQINAGAPADVLLSADLAQMDKVKKATDRVNLLSNSLVVIGTKDLVEARRIAIADPAVVPAGIYARKWLEEEKLWAAVEKKVVPTLDVRAALAAVESGNADCGIVYKTDAAISKKVKVIREVPREQGPEIVYPVAAISPAGKDFVAFLRGPIAGEIFERHGFVFLPR